MPPVMQDLPVVTFPNGESWPALGQGTWQMGERPERRSAEIAALRAGVDLGLTVIDTAETYGDGASEELVAEALSAHRDELFITTKVLPTNASYGGVITACEASLARLQTDRIDLYLLHWPRDEIAVSDETFEAFESLMQVGKIRSWGVSNFALADMQALMDKPWGSHVATNQILFNLRRRGPSLDLIPWCNERGIPTTAYSPIETARMLVHPGLNAVAAMRGATAAQIALAWLLRQPGLLTIPKAGSVKHVDENRAAVDIDLTEDELARLDAAFPAPAGPVPFEMN